MQKVMAGGGVTLNLRLDKIKKNKIKIKGTKEMSARLLSRALLSRLIRTRLRQGRTKGDFQFSVINDCVRVLITLLSQPHVKAMIHTNNIAGLLIAISIY